MKFLCRGTVCLPPNRSWSVFTLPFEYRLVSWLLWAIRLRMDDGWWMIMSLQKFCSFVLFLEPDYVHLFQEGTPWNWAGLSQSSLPEQPDPKADPLAKSEEWTSQAHIGLPKQELGLKTNRNSCHWIPRWCCGYLLCCIIRTSNNQYKFQQGHFPPGILFSVY